MSVRRLTIGALLLVGAGCRTEPDAGAAPSATVAPTPTPSATAAHSAASAARAAAPAVRAPAPVSSVARLPGGPATRVVFLDQKKHCPCNADQIASAWRVVDQIRARRPALAVERVHADVDKQRETKLRATRNFWTFPAIYVFDARGNLTALLQGDLTEAEIADALR